MLKIHLSQSKTPWILGAKCGPQTPYCKGSGPLSGAGREIDQGGESQGGPNMVILEIEGHRMDFFPPSSYI